MKLTRNIWLGILIVLLLSAWLGIRKLNADGVWFDEWWSLYVSGADQFAISRAPAAIWQRITEEDIRQGVLYPYALAGWGSAVGWSEFATRALSLLGGMVALAAVFRLGWAFSKKPLIGLSAAALLGTSVWFIYFLHEMRVYMLLVMFTALLLLLYHRVTAWRSPPRPADYAALAVVTGLLLNTHYFACLVVGVLGIWHLVQLRRRPTRRWWGVLAAWVVSGIMLIPWLINLPTAAALAINEPRVTPNAALLFDMARDTFAAFSNGSLALLAILFAFSLLNRRARWLWLLFLLLLPLNLAAYYVFSLNELRYNMALLPFLALLAGVGVAELAHRRIPAALVLTVWAAGVFALEGSFDMERTLQHWPAQPIRQMADVLRLRVQPDDLIINLLGEENRPTLALHPLVYYMGDFGARIEVVENSTFPGTNNFVNRVAAALGDPTPPHVWLANDPRWEIQEWDLFEYLLNQRDLYHCATLAETADMLIWGFGHVDAAAQGWQFGDAVTVSLLGAPRVSGDTLQVWLGFQISDQTPPDTYSTALHLLGADGALAAQFDAPLPPAGNSCRYEEIPLSALPAGDYALHMAVYRWQDGERLVSDDTDYPLLASVSLPAP